MLDDSLDSEVTGDHVCDGCIFCVKYMCENDLRTITQHSQELCRFCIFLCRVPKNLLDIYCGFKITHSIFIYTSNVYRCILYIYVLI